MSRTNPSRLWTRACTDLPVLYSQRSLRLRKLRSVRLHRNIGLNILYKLTVVRSISSSLFLTSDYIYYDRHVDTFDGEQLYITEMELPLLI
jgi:hypothetical protein